jgi:hypothetical protein
MVWFKAPLPANINDLAIIRKGCCLKKKNSPLITKSNSFIRRKPIKRSSKKVWCTAEVYYGIFAG